MYSWSMEHSLAGWKFVKLKSRKVEKATKAFGSIQKGGKRIRKRHTKRGKDQKVRKVRGKGLVNLLMYN
jgi:hypothetical protein